MKKGSNPPPPKGVKKPDPPPCPPRIDIETYAWAWCLNCLNEIMDEWTYCPDCGTKLYEEK